MTKIPEGYEPHFKHSMFTDPWEPIYSKILETEVRLGVVVAEAHCNSRGFAHGAFLTALADNATGLSCGTCMSAAGLTVGSLVTVNLGIDFLGVAQIGTWINTETVVVKVGKSQSVAHCLVVSNDGPVARVNATFRNLVKN